MIGTELGPPNVCKRRLRLWRRTDAAKEAYSRRAPAIEGVFGCIKGAMGIRGFLTRGREKVRTEWRWICSAYSMRKLMGILTARRTPDAASAQNSARTNRDGAVRPLILTMYNRFGKTVFANAA